MDEQEVGGTVIDEGDKSGASDGLESDASDVYMRPTTNTTQSCVEVPTGMGKR
jgi:hypothetical protein